MATAPAIWLLTVSPRNPATGAVQVVRFACGGSVGYNQFDTTDWRAGLKQPPVIAQRLGFDDGHFGDGSIVQALQMVWAGGAEGVKAMKALYWRDAAFTLHNGPDGGATADMALILTGKIADVSANITELTLQMADPAIDLAKPIITATYAGTGGIEGDPELKGTAKSRAWGRLFNVSLRSLDKANNIWVASDPAFAIQAFDQVYDRGNAASSLVLVDWAGSVAATLAALIATHAPDGGAAIAPSIACVKWWFANPGKLTCDMRGEVGAGYVDRPTDIAGKMIGIVGGIATNAGMIATARAVCDQEAGWMVNDTNTTIAAEITNLLSGVGLWWGLSAAGAIEMGEWAFGASTADFVSVKAELMASYRPVADISLGWKRNQTVMARGDIAAVVLDAAYADGTAIVPNEVITVAALPAAGTALKGRDYRLTSDPNTLWQVQNGLIAATYNQSTGYGYTGAASGGAGMRDGVFSAPSGMGTAADLAAFIAMDLGSVRDTLKLYLAPFDVVPDGWGAIYLNAHTLQASADDSATPAAGSWVTLTILSGHVVGQTKAYDIPAGYRHIRVTSAGLALGLSYIGISEMYAIGAAWAKIATNDANLRDQSLLTIDKKPDFIANETRQLNRKDQIIAAATGYAIQTNAPYVALGSAWANWIAARNVSNWNNLTVDTSRDRTVWDGLQNTLEAAMVAAETDLAARAKYSDGSDINTLQPTTTDADNTALATPRCEPSAVSIDIYCDSVGAPLGTSLPINASVKRWRGATDVSASGTAWSIVGVSGIMGGTVTVSNGVHSIPTGVSLATSGGYTVRSVRDGVTIDVAVSFTRKDAAAGGASGGGTSDFDEALGTVSTTGFVAISKEMTIKTGSGGQLVATAPLGTDVAAASPYGTFDVEIKAQWKTVGGAYADFAAAVSSDPDAVCSNPEGFPESERGAVSLNQTKTGLAATTDHVVRLVGRRTTSTLAKSVQFIGRFTASGG